jgi:ankyrin repeat protein
MRNSSQGSEFTNLFATSNIIEQHELTNLHRIILKVTSADLQAQLKLAVEDIDTQDAFGKTPLMWAAWTRNSNAVRVLVDSGADINKVDIIHNSALHLAAYSWSEESFNILLEAGAHAAAADLRKIQPIHITSMNSHGAGMIKALISQGADADARTIRGSTPLHKLAEEHHDLRSNIKVLLENGANIDAINDDGWRPVMIASGYSVKNFEYLVEMSARLDVGAPNGENILHRAAYAGSMEHWEILQNAAKRGRLVGVDPEARDNDGDDAWYFLRGLRDKMYFGERVGEDVERAVFSKLIDAVKAANETHQRDTEEYHISGSFE